MKTKRFRRVRALCLAAAQPASRTFAGDDGVPPATNAQSPDPPPSGSGGPPAQAGPPAGPTARVLPGQMIPQQVVSPLQFKIGSVYITPIGFVDATWVTRSANLGSGIGANFGAIPFHNVPQGRLTDGIA